MLSTVATPPRDPLLLFGQRVAALRRARGWSQERLALESGLARSYLGGVERGQRNIALLNILRLAEALDCPPADLLKLDRDRPAT
ncbi:helix-turn-helix domain-containing protein [Aromatoleum toluclasticum]|uniref:helix-turn-helix domain-containing protein n=1 Tax=Aromatoleum toluclasticum TaxID=92003 RepID=UPI00038101FB|nr:helix-turn-helix transcriptional regulator [Aromatoleum toluclasticum]